MSFTPLEVLMMLSAFALYGRTVPKNAIAFVALVAVTTLPIQILVWASSLVQGLSLVTCMFLLCVIQEAISPIDPTADPVGLYLYFLMGLSLLSGMVTITTLLCEVFSGF